MLKAKVDTLKIAAFVEAFERNNADEMPDDPFTNRLWAKFVAFEEMAIEKLPEAADLKLEALSDLLLRADDVAAMFRIDEALALYRTASTLCAEIEASVR